MFTNSIYKTILNSNNSLKFRTPWLIRGMQNFFYETQNLQNANISLFLCFLFRISGKKKSYSLGYCVCCTCLSAKIN